MKKLLPILLAALIFSCGGPGEEVSAPGSLQDWMGGDGGNWKQAVSGRSWKFPADHADHPDFQSEWWYFTGILESDEGKRFGYQFTVFRRGMGKVSGSAGSKWVADQLYMGHLAISDIDGKKHISREKMGRNALEMAGVSTKPVRIWLENWKMEAGNANGDFFPLNISAHSSGISLDLQLEEGMFVLHGDNGFSPKGENSASYYYSYVQIPTSGSLKIGEQSYSVKGKSWFDHEFFSNALDKDQKGWDWFSLQNEDGSALMLFRVRSDKESFLSGTFIDSSEKTHALSAGDIFLESVRYEKVASGNRYPLKWKVRVPSQSLDFMVEPFFPNQEMKTGISYWEGAVHAEGSLRNKPMKAVGYLEMTGYAGEDDH